MYIKRYRVIDKTLRLTIMMINKETVKQRAQRAENLRKKLFSTITYRGSVFEKKILADSVFEIGRAQNELRQNKIEENRLPVINEKMIELSAKLEEMADKY
jgi:hypothetical protein